MSPITGPDSAPGSRPVSWFFEQFPRFYTTSSTFSTTDRLNLRYEAVSGENYGPDRARFVTGDVHEVLSTQDFEADVVLCLGFLYHTLRYNELLHGIRRANAHHLIIDTFSPHMMRPVPNVNVISEPAGEQGKAVGDAYTHGPRVLVGLGRPAAG